MNTRPKAIPKAQVRAMALLVLFCLAAIPTMAQFVGRQGRTDELADYARYKKSKVAMARTWLQEADTNGILDPSGARQLIQTRYFDPTGREQRDTIYHISDGLPFFARSTRYKDGRYIGSEENVLSAEAPLTNREEIHLDDQGYMYMRIGLGGDGRNDTTLYILNAEGNVDHYYHMSQQGRDTVQCELDAQGRITRTTRPGKPSRITEISYNERGQMTRIADTEDYGLLGQVEMAVREFDFNKKGLPTVFRDYDQKGRLQSVFTIEYWNRKGKRLK